MRKNAFTLAEIMVVLVVIGVLTCILTPIVANSIPDKNVMKFKKADTTLRNTIRELVNSDKYYIDGDLGMRKMPNGEGQLLDGTHNGDYTYFCNTLTEILTIKSKDCSEKGHYSHANQINWIDFSDFKGHFDRFCIQYQEEIGDQILLSDNIVFFEGSSITPFGAIWAANNRRLFGNPNTTGEDASVDEFGFKPVYKHFCIDIDGYNSNTACDDKKDICPFGYGIRVDGKILTGARADSWLAKDFQGKDPSKQE